MVPAAAARVRNWRHCCHHWTQPAAVIRPRLCGTRHRRPDTGQEVADVAARVEAKPMREVSTEEATQSRQLA
jgi:hypothetical protein